MATPMALNLKLLNDASSELVDAMMHRHMIGSLMYLMSIRPDNFLCYEHLEPVRDRFETCSLDCCKAYSEVPGG